jgi:ketosteroid isomerase-like protein
MHPTTDNLAVVRDILDRMLPAADLQPLLRHLADDVVFTVAGPDGGLSADDGDGKAAVAQYFGTLGDLVTFWHVKHAWSGGRVVVLIDERFTVHPIGLAAQSELALIFDVQDGMITRLLIVEDLPAALSGTGVALSLEEPTAKPSGAPDRGLTRPLRSTAR